jgi:ABC-type cobalamin/Fe3+-siderophores transport system ATPase subunit
MSDGKIAAHGATQTVLNPETLRTVFNIEAKVYHETYSQSLQVVFRK